MKNKTITFALPTSEHEKLKSIAEKSFSDISKTLRKMIASYTQEETPSEKGKEQAR